MAEQPDLPFMTTYDESTPPPDVDSARARRWAIWHHQFDLVRAEDGVRYLRRHWIIKTPLGGIILHRMDGPDARDTLHDHPWTFVSIVLRGGYVERRLRPRTYDVDERHVVRRVNRLRVGVDAHSIRELMRVPTWTLLLVGPVRRTWGFLEPDSLTGIVVQPKGWRWLRHDAFDSGHYVPGLHDEEKR